MQPTRRPQRSNIECASRGDRSRQLGHIKGTHGRSGSKANPNLKLDHTIGSRKPCFGGSKKRTSVQVVPLGDDFQQIEMRSRTQNLNIRNTSLGEPDGAVAVVDLLLTFVAIKLNEPDVESIGLAVVVNSHHRLVS